MPNQHQHASQSSVTASTQHGDAEIEAYMRKASSGGLSGVPALTAFQRRMDAYPQLSPEEQRRMVERVRAGKQAADMLTRARSERRRTELRKQVRDGEKAAEYLVGSNFRLVLLICAEKARERFGAERLSEVLPDLVAEANVAVAEAIDNYDETKIPVFVTYLGRVVRDRVQHALTLTAPIRVASSWSRLRRIAAVRIPQLEVALGRYPTEDEIKDDLLAQCMVWAKKRLTPQQLKLPQREQETLMMAKLRKQGMLSAINSLNDVILTGSVSSIDVATFDDGSGTVASMIADDVDITIDIERQELNDALTAAIARFSEREQFIIRSRFGFGVSGADPQTHRAIGEQLNITAERVRQIEKAVLEELADDPDFRSSVMSHLAALS